MKLVLQLAHDALDDPSLLFKAVYPRGTERKDYCCNPHMVLLLGVRDDDGWPSEKAVTRMVKILEETGYPYRVEHHVYDKASHALTDGLNELSGYAKWAFKNMLPAEKKYPKECEEARQDSFRRILAFLEGWN